MLSPSFKKRKKMRKCIFLVFTLVCVLSYGQQNSATTDSGVVINGVKWATRNVDNPGTFATQPESAGKIYQWNRKKAWSATEEWVDDWDISGASGTVWEKSNDPSPAGWRIPTHDEIEKLLDRNKVSQEFATVNGVNGRKFTDKASGASIFLPIVGYRIDNSGRLYCIEDCGYYWCSALFSRNRSYYLTFSKGGASRGRDSSPVSGFNVRCVAE
jgi:uncharacterized protein (TIGR02145 family)